MKIDAIVEALVVALRNREGATGLSVEEVMDCIRLSEVWDLKFPKSEAERTKALSTILAKAEASARRTRDLNANMESLRQITEGLEAGA